MARTRFETEGLSKTAEVEAQRGFVKTEGCKEKFIDKAGEKTRSKKGYNGRNRNCGLNFGAICGLVEEQEAYKGVRGMPRLSETTKDVVSCEKLRGAANER